MAEEQPPKQYIETLAQWLLEGEHIVAFTGAGISTESGIPIFAVRMGSGRGAMLAYRRPSGASNRIRSNPTYRTWRS